MNYCKSITVYECTATDKTKCEFFKPFVYGGKLCMYHAIPGQCKNKAAIKAIEKKPPIQIPWK